MTEPAPPSGAGFRFTRKRKKEPMLAANVQISLVGVLVVLAIIALIIWIARR